MYLDLQETTRQDRQLEARAAALNQTTERIWILFYIACGFFVFLLLSIITLIRRHKAAKELKAGFEELEEELARLKLENSKGIRAMVEQRACVQIINSMLPLIERMKHAAKMGNMDYCRELAIEIERQNNLLTDWIKMRRGNIRPHIENVILSDIFSVVRKTSTSNITTKISPSSAIVKADTALTLFLVNTLVDNARKSGATEIDVNTTTGSNYAEISVSDNGRGMSEEQLAHLFEFKQIDGNGGFGLQNCRGIIDRYRKISSLFSVCMISAKSTLGKGTTVSFRLPLAKCIVFLLMQFFSINLCANNVERYADSLYNCNIQGRYADALKYADSCKALAAEADSITLLSVYNEDAVASLAMHKWERYRSSNWQYTLLYRELTADKSLPNYYRSMQRAEMNANIAMLVIVILIISLIPLMWFLYLKPIVIKRRKERERQTLLEEEIASLRQENERLHVSTSITDNQLSTVKHETMYYPSRILQLIDSNCPETTIYQDEGLLQGKNSDVINTIEYYKELCQMLSSKVLKQKPLNVSMLHELKEFLEFLIKRHKDDPLTEQQVADLFTLNTPHSDYLVMRQIMREIGEITHNRNSGISATYKNGKAVITLNS
jgi:signal transduction histidine kinase